MQRYQFLQLAIYSLRKTEYVFSQVYDHQMKRSYQQHMSSYPSQAFRADEFKLILNDAKKIRTPRKVWGVVIVS